MRNLMIDEINSDYDNEADSDAEEETASYQ